MDVAVTHPIRALKVGGSGKNEVFEMRSLLLIQWVVVHVNGPITYLLATRHHIHQTSAFPLPVVSHRRSIQ